MPKKMTGGRKKMTGNGKKMTGGRKKRVVRRRQRGGIGAGQRITAQIPLIGPLINAIGNAVNKGKDW